MRVVGPCFDEQAVVQLYGQCMDLSGQLGVGVKLQLFLDRIVIGLGLLVTRLAVLSDENER